ncbi:MAG: alpha/beta fold hydrolase [Actinobacteria bacterium]|nr:alpha/beta fold hydrolase [Actinomycetota bacterium]
MDPGLRSGSGRPSWLDGRLFPFRSRFLELDGCRVHYVDEGEGAPLLLLHGNPTWSFLYRDIIGGLRDRFRCVALDYPGFGLSSAREGYGFTPAEHARIVERFLLALDLSDTTLMVQDWGGPIGLGVASRHPGRFRALVVGNTWAWPVNGNPRFELFSRLVGGPPGGFLIRNFNAFVNLLVPAGVRRGRLPKEVMAAYRGPFSRRSSREPTYVFPREILGSSDYLAGVERELESLAKLPVLIVWGDRDPAFREAERSRFEQAFPEHRTAILRGAGHFIQEDAADEIVAEIASWWR